MGENKTSVLMLVLRKMRLFAYVSFAIVFILSIFIINLIADSTESASAATGTATAATTSLVISNLGATSAINITPTRDGAAFASGGTISFDITTNNYTGYGVELVNLVDEGKLVNTEDDELYLEVITDDYYTDATFPTNKWGIKPSRYVDPTNNTIVDNTGNNARFVPFQAVLDTESGKMVYGVILDVYNTAGSNTYTIETGAKVDAIMKSGTYESSYNLIAVAAPAPYSITYNSNTEDVVTNMPTGQSGDASETSIALSNLLPAREHYSFIGWCSVQPTTANGTDSCSGTVYNPNGAGTDLTYGIDQTTATNNATLYAMWQIDTFTCTKQYRLQNADGTWGNYVTDGTETINYGGSCAYAKSITDYKNAANGTNNVQASTTATNVTDDVTVSLGFYRNTFALTVSKGDNITAVTGAGTYRWGDTATITATKTANVTCISYANPTYTATAGTAPTAGASTTYTMPKSNATVTATSAASNVAQTITFKTSNATNITLDGNTKTNNQTLSINCGTYNITGTIPANYHFVSWGASAGSLGSTSQLSTTYTVSGPATITLTGTIDTYIQTTRYRYENADGTWGSWTTAETVSKNYGATYSWSTSQIANFNSTAYQAASVASYTVTGAKTNDVSIYRNTFTCTKQYRLETAAGGWGSYTADGTTTVRYGASCSYSKTVTDYRGSSNATNGAQGSTSASNITENKTLQLSFYRNTYTLTVTAGTNTSSATGGGTKRWGEAVTVGVTKAANVTCTTYGTPTWTQSGTAGTFSATSGTSVTFTMGKGNATVTATSAATNVAQTITLSRGTGVASIKIGSTNYTAASVSLNCGTYNISGVYSTGYVFFSWEGSSGVAVASASTASTTMTVSGSGTLALTGRLYLQNVTSAICPTTATAAYDSRDGTAYTIQKLADGKCWLLDNLRLDLANATVKAGLSSSNTNASDTSLGYLKSGGGTTSDKFATDGVANWSGGDSYSGALIKSNWRYSSNGTGGYTAGTFGIFYNYCAVSAGSYCYGDGDTYGSTATGNATDDICPKGWRLPTGGTSGEYQALYAAYSSNYTNFVNALRTPLAGLISNNGRSNIDHGYYWTSTWIDVGRMNSLDVSTSTITTDVTNTSNGWRRRGYSVRCVLK